MNGSEIKQMIKSSGFYEWQVAERMGISDSQFSRKLRYTFNEKDIASVQKAITELTNAIQ